MRELDIAAGQIVRWLREEVEKGKSNVRYEATREYITDTKSNLLSLGFEGDDAGLSKKTIGQLEVRPSDATHGWRMTTYVEDALGSHIPDDHSVSDLPEEIDLDDFESRFTSDDRDPGHTQAFFDLPCGEKNFERILEKIVRNKH